MLVFVPSMLTLLLEYVQLEKLPAAQMLTKAVPARGGSSIRVLYESPLEKKF